MKRSPPGKKTDADPILNAIVRTAARLCDASYCHLYLVDGGLLRNVAKHGSLARSVAVGGSFPIGRGSVAGRAVHDRRTVHVRDLKAVAKGEFKDAVTVQRAAGLRTMLATPLLQDGRAIGALVVLRSVVRPFTAHQIALLKTFAEQATIALENARLSRELEARNHDLAEALGRETATGAILGVISRSPTDIEPVLSAVAESAARLCHAYDATVFRLEGDVLRLAAHHGPVTARPTLPLSRDTLGGRSILEGRPVQVADALIDDDEFPGISRFAREHGHRTLLSVPLLREGVPIGAIQLRRTEVAPFTDTQIALLQTFADQAVIAIENVRLFTELEKRNRELTQALEQQTATSDILQVISSSPTDLQPVFTIIAESAVKLCNAEVGFVARLEGEWVEAKAAYGTSAAELDALRSVYPRRVSDAATATGARAIRDGVVIHIPDVLADAEHPARQDAIASGFRATLGVPMVRDGRAIGSITIGRAEAGAFSERQIALLQTFADQALIAIENVRLFTELEKRNQELTDSLTQQTATADILRVISNSPTDIQPVLDAVLESAARLCEAVDSQIFLQHGDVLRQAAHRGPLRSGRVGEYAVPIIRGTVNGRAMLEARTVHVRDLAAESAEFPEGSAIAREFGHRTALSVPCFGRVCLSAPSSSGATRCAPSASGRSCSCRHSPTRPSSPSRTCACSPNWGSAIAISRRRWISRRRPARFCA